MCTCEIYVYSHWIRLSYSLSHQNKVNPQTVFMVRHCWDNATVLQGDFVQRDAVKGHFCLGVCWNFCNIGEAALQIEKGQ